ncbi:hypothetical protein FHX69_0254 [Prauserella muralis]|nr:hypothetical protein FHX69_0254 [Prauserella muralis]
MEYDTPEPKAPDPGALLSGQGFMNVAMGYRDRDRDELLRAREASERLGIRSTPKCRRFPADSICAW